MDRREIEIFIAVMRLGSVTAAAQALGMAQPSVSKAIALSERRLGFALFDRVRSRLVPTAEAQLIMEEAMRIEGELARFDRYLSSIRHLQTGQLRVAATPALALSLLPLVAASVRLRLPNYGFVLDMHLNHEIPGAVERGQYDLGLAVVPATDESDTLRPLRRGRMVAVLPLDHPLARASSVAWPDIDRADFIYITTDARLIALLATKVPAFTRRLSSAIETNRYTTAVNMVRNGGGVTLVDEFTLVGEDMSALAVRPFLPETEVSLVATTSPFGAPKRALGPFIEEIENILSRHLPAWPPPDAAAN